MIKNKKVAIVGGGPCGIGAAKWLTQFGMDVEIIERESAHGGLWNIESDQARRVYKSAHIISCRSITELSDAPMPDNYPHYPNHQLMLQYIQSLASKFNLSDRTIFNTSVTAVRIMDNHEFELTLNNVEKKRYGALVLATGLLNTPVYPDYRGTFSGKIMHSKDYIEMDAFKNKRVLIVGGGNSGCDIAVDLCRYADRVYQSTRRAYHYMPKFIHGLPTQEWLISLSNGNFKESDFWSQVKKEFQAAGFAPEDYGLPKPDYPMYACHPIMNSQLLYHIGHGDIFQYPDIAAFDGNLVRFINGASVNVDVVVYATGFRPDFSLLNNDVFSSPSIFDETYIRFLHKKYHHLFLFGYFNSPSGLGNLLNLGGKLLALLLRAYFENHPILQTIQGLKNGPEPNLGNGIFIRSERHQHEYDLWKTALFMRSMIDKLENA